MRRARSEVPARPGEGCRRLGHPGADETLPAVHHARPRLGGHRHASGRGRHGQGLRPPAQRVVLPRREVERREARQVGEGRRKPGIVEGHPPAGVLPPAPAYPLGAQERVAAGPGVLGEGVGDRHVEPARDRDEAGGRRQPFVACRQQRTEAEQAAARVTADDEVRRVGPRRQQSAVGAEAVMVRRRERVLRGEAVVRHHHTGLELLGEHGAVEVVVVERARHEAAPVAVEDDPIGSGPAGVVVPRAAHPAELRLGHRDRRGHGVAVETGPSSPGPPGSRPPGRRSRPGRAPGSRSAAGSAPGPQASS